MACLDLSGAASPTAAADPSKKIAAFAVFDGHVREFEPRCLLRRNRVFFWLVLLWACHGRAVVRRGQAVLFARA